MSTIFSERSSNILNRIQKAALSSSLNIVQIFKVITTFASEAIDLDVKCCNVDRGQDKLYVCLSIFFFYHINLGFP